MNRFCGPGFSFPLGARTYVMGIVNVTPDSFSDGGLYAAPDAAIQHALRLEQEGADLVDLGAESTRPGHTPVSAEEEMRRLRPVLEGLRGKLKVPISVDTFKPETARMAVELGAAVLNDVEDFSDEMARVAAESGAAVVIMHPGAVEGHREIAAGVRDYLKKTAARAEQNGVPAERICLDPGFGFGKDARENLELLAFLRQAKPEGYAFLAGLSRKRFIGSCTGCAVPAQRVAGTVAADTLAALGGADIVRVHDVAAAVQAARVFDAVRAARVTVQAGRTQEEGAHGRD